MGAAVGLREDFGADELRRLAAKVKDAAQARRFNQYGPDGLIDIKPTGRPSKLSDEQKEALKQLVCEGGTLLRTIYLATLV
jgi:transposase